MNKYPSAMASNAGNMIGEGYSAARLQISTMESFFSVAPHRWFPAESESPPTDP